MRLPVVRFGESVQCESAAAFYIGGATISRQQLLMRAQSIAEHLAGSANYCVNLCSCRYQFTLGFSAALLAGMTSLLPSNRQTHTITRVLEEYTGAIVLHDKPLELELAFALSEKGVRLVDVNDVQDSKVSDATVSSKIPGNQLAAVVFTSGSTGEPSAILKPWRTLFGTTALLQQRFLQAAFSPADSVPSIVATVPPQHMYGLESTVMMSLYGNCAVESSHPFFPADIVQALNKVPAPRLLITTPVHMKALLQSDLVLPAIDTIISATAPLSAEIAAQAESKWLCVVKEIYGCSEAGSLASRRTATDSEWTLLDDVLLESIEGETCVKASHLSGTVPLHDRLELVSTSQFRLLGRSDDMLNIAGKRASLAQLTAQLQAIEGVVDGVFFLREDGGDDVRRVAALVVSDRPESELAEVLSKLIDPAFMPRPLRKVPQIPRNAVGKVPRDQLMQALRAATRLKQQ